LRRKRKTSPGSIKGNLNLLRSLKPKRVKTPEVTFAGDTSQQLGVRQISGSTARRIFAEQKKKVQFDQDQVLVFDKKYSLHLSGLRSRRMKRRRRTWTAKDVRTLKKLANKRTRAANIARKLRRTEGATRQKAFSLGLSLESRAAKI